MTQTPKHEQDPVAGSVPEQRGYASPPCYQHEIDPSYLGYVDQDRSDTPSPDSPWESVRTWRAQQRLQLISLRESLTVNQRAQYAGAIIKNLHAANILSGHTRIGFYWPLPGEIDLRPLVIDFIKRGNTAALPVITGPKQPLEFWKWSPGDTLSDSGPWGILAPAQRQLVNVSLILVPMVGFDDQGHRLGHGGGYYDRTLASMAPQPIVIGIGYEACRLRSIFPQSHDIPMDAVVTESHVDSSRPETGILPVLDTSKQTV